MRPGAQWIAFDAYFYGSAFAQKLLDRFGLAGPAVFLAFLCACKRSRTPGEITFMSDAEALHLMGLTGRRLVDDSGAEWTLDEFWNVCGRQKNTVRTRRGRVLNVRATHWERWQEESDRYTERMKKRRQRAQNEGDTTGTAGGQTWDRGGEMSPSTYDSDSDISPPTPSHAENGQDPAATANQKRGNRKTTRKANGHIADPVVDHVRRCVPGTGPAAAKAAVERLRQQGVADVVIEEAAGYAAQNDGRSANYVERIALDWMSQRDPTWVPTTDTTTDPRPIGDALKRIVG